MENVNKLLAMLTEITEFVMPLDAAEITEFLERAENYHSVILAEIAFIVERCRRISPDGIFYIGNESGLTVYFDTGIPVSLALIPEVKRVGLAFKHFKKIAIADVVELRAGADYKHRLLCDYTHLAAIDNQNFVLHFWWG